MGGYGRNRMRIFLMLPLFLFVSCSWYERCDDVSVNKLTDSSYGLVIEDFDWGENKISQRNGLDLIIKKIAAINGSWADPWYSPPLGRGGIVLYNENGELINTVRIGRNRISLKGCGAYQYKRISDAERAELFSLLSTPDPYKSIPYNPDFFERIINFFE